MSAHLSQIAKYFENQFKESTDLKTTFCPESALNVLVVRLKVYLLGLFIIHSEKTNRKKNLTIRIRIADGLDRKYNK